MTKQLVENQTPLITIDELQELMNLSWNQRTHRYDPVRRVN